MTYNYKNIWMISYPILAGMIVQQLVGLIDTAFLGRVGEIELGASAIAGVFYIMIFMLGHGFSIGAQIIIARRNGEQNYDKIGEVFYQGIGFVILGAICFIVLSLWLSPIILRNIISSPEIYDASIKYLDIRVFGFIFSFMVVMFRSFYVGITNTKPLAFNAMIMLVTNVILDYIFIFGKSGFPAMGIEGAASASVIAEAASALFFIFYTGYRIDLKKYGLNLIRFFNLPILKEILNVSIWTMLQSFVSLLTWFFFFVAIEHLGKEPLAISNILRSISSLPFLIAAAFGGAANSITSNLIGSGKDEEVMPTSSIIIKMGYAIGIAAEIVMAVFPRLTMRIYTDNMALIEQSVPAFYTMLLIYLTTVPGMILFNVVSGTGHTKRALFMELIAMVFYAFSIWYVVIYLRADIAVCWTVEHSYNIVLFIVAYRYLKSRKWWCKSQLPESGDEPKECIRV